MGWFDRVKEALSGEEPGGAPDQPRLRREVAEAVMRLRHRGRRGVEVFPAAVAITVTAPADSVEVVRGFLRSPAFDAELEAELLNRLVEVDAEALPLRRYAVGEGGVLVVEARPAEPGVTHRLVVEGGDRDGEALDLDGAKRRFLLGRGPWHGPDDRLANDLVVCRAAPFVSRRAARVERAAGAFLVTSLDQGECLAVLRADGQRLRPAMTRSGALRLEAGEALELNDGGERRIRLVLEIAGGEGEP